MPIYKSAEFQSMARPEVKKDRITLQSMLLSSDKEKSRINKKRSRKLLSGSQMDSVVIALHDQILVIGSERTKQHMLTKELPVTRMTFGQVNDHLNQDVAYLAKWRKWIEVLVTTGKLISGHPFGSSHEVLFLDMTKK
jgi:hypothetical protein